MPIIDRYDSLYSPQNIADMFGVSRRTVYKWLKSGLLHTIKAGPKLRFVTQGQLDTFLRASERTIYREVKPSRQVTTGEEFDAEGLETQGEAVVKPSQKGIGSPVPKANKKARRR